MILGEVSSKDFSLSCLFSCEYVAKLADSSLAYFSRKRKKRGNFTLSAESQDLLMVAG